MIPAPDIHALDYLLTGNAGQWEYFEVLFDSPSSTPATSVAGVGVLIDLIC